MYFWLRDNYIKSFEFRVSVDALIQAHLTGEVYEDTRPQTLSEKLPIVSNLSLILGGKITTTRLSAGPENDEVLESESGEVVTNDNLGNAVNFWQKKVFADIDALVTASEKVRRELIRQ